VEAVLKSSLGWLWMEVTSVHKAGAREVGDVVREKETRIKSNVKVANRGIRHKSRGRRVSGTGYVY